MRKPSPNHGTLQLHKDDDVDVDGDDDDGDDDDDELCKVDVITFLRNLNSCFRFQTIMY